MHCACLVAGVGNANRLYNNVGDAPAHLLSKLKPAKVPTSADAPLRTPLARQRLQDEAPEGRQPLIGCGIPVYAGRVQVGHKVRLHVHLQTLRGAFCSIAISVAPGLCPSEHTNIGMYGSAYRFPWDTCTSKQTVVLMLPVHIL